MHFEIPPDAVRRSARQSLSAIVRCDDSDLRAGAGVAEMKLSSTPRVRFS
jgi:hypothetical protein